jgi:signal peptidase II
MQKNTHTRSLKRWIYFLWIPTALLVLVDEWIKYLALERLPSEGDLLNPGILELAIHQNFGIAFNIPFKMPIIIAVSILIGIALIHSGWKNRNLHPDITFSSFLIVLGAIGNLYDRIIYGFTVDYLILFGRSAINISDCIIIAGVILLLFASRRQKKKEQIDKTKKIP